MRNETVVGEKGQVTIPKNLRERLGLAPGSTLVFEERDGALIARRVVRVDPLSRLVGLGTERGVDVHSWIAESRGPAWSADLDDVEESEGRGESSARSRSADSRGRAKRASRKRDGT